MSQNALISPEMLKEVERWSRGGDDALVLKEEGASTRHMGLRFGSGTGSCSEPLKCLSEASSHLGGPSMRVLYATMNPNIWRLAWTQKEREREIKETEKEKQTETVTNR